MAYRQVIRTSVNSFDLFDIFSFD
jgi:hypothetical protein